tara:strand:+ start:1201 stop:1467 length:267 start_codon:yes stop_codon:yes gene_type:complete
MKKTIIIASVVALLGCGTIKGWFASKDDNDGTEHIEETFRPPVEGEIIQNPDGSFTVMEKKARPWGWIFLISGLVVAGFAARYYIKNK